MNRTLRGIIVALFFVVFLLLSGGRRFGVDSESLFLPVLILVFFGLIVTIWFAPEPQRRIGVWGITLFALSTWPVVQHKAILIFLALAPLVVSEWRYSHPSAAQRMAREDHYEKHSHLAGCYHIARDSLSVNSPDLLTR